MLTTATSVYTGTGGDFTGLDFGSGTPVVSASTNGASLAQWGDTMYMTTGVDVWLLISGKLLILM